MYAWTHTHNFKSTKRQGLRALVLLPPAIACHVGTVDRKKLQGTKKRNNIYISFRESKSLVSEVIGKGHTYTLT